MKEKEKYTLVDFQNSKGEDRAQLLQKLDLSVENEEFFQIVFAPKPGVQTSVTKVPLAMAEYFMAHLDGKSESLKFIHRVRPIHYDVAYDQIKTRFGFSHVTLQGGKNPNQWLLVSAPETAGEHKDKVLDFLDFLRQHGYQLNEGECLQIDICKTWKETKK